MASGERSYLPAAGHDWFLPLYDPLVKVLGGDSARRTLLEHASLRGGDRVLDVGCGTGTLAVLVKRRHPDVDFVGIDPDPKALARAGDKAKRAGVEVRLDRGFADELPYPDASFDHVLSSLMFHHLPDAQKTRAMREVRRVLKPGVSLHLLDLRPADAGGFLTRLFHSHERMAANAADRIVATMKEAGLADAREVARPAMLFTRLSLYEASAPAP